MCYHSPSQPPDNRSQTVFFVFVVKQPLACAAVASFRADKRKSDASSSAQIGNTTSSVANSTEKQLSCRKGDALRVLCRAGESRTWVLCENLRTGRRGVVPLVRNQRVFAISKACMFLIFLGTPVQYRPPTVSVFCPAIVCSTRRSEILCFFVFVPLPTAMPVLLVSPTAARSCHSR
jgi:hypothetical protein